MAGNAAHSSARTVGRRLGDAVGAAAVAVLLVTGSVLAGFGPTIVLASPGGHYA